MRKAFLAAALTVVAMVQAASDEPYMTPALRLYESVAATRKEVQLTCRSMRVGDGYLSTCEVCWSDPREKEPLKCRFFDPLTPPRK